MTTDIIYIMCLYLITTIAMGYIVIKTLVTGHNDIKMFIMKVLNKE